MRDLLSEESREKPYYFRRGSTLNLMYGSISGLSRFSEILSELFSRGAGGAVKGRAAVRQERPSEWEQPKEEKQAQNAGQ